jgi:chitin synthase
VTLCYLVAFLCGLLAYVIYGLNIDVCPTDTVTFPFATDVDGQRVPVQRDEDVSVFGQIYSFNTMQTWFATQNLNLTTAFQGMEIGSMFDGDTNNACAAYSNSLPACSITSPSGKFFFCLYF